jgi:recombination protein RecA
MVEFDISFGNGIDKLGCLLDAAERCRILNRKGAWYQYQDLKLGQGKRAAIEFLQANTTCMNEIDTLVRKSIESQKHRISSAGEHSDEGGFIIDDESLASDEEDADFNSHDV